MADERAPVLIGVAQSVDRPREGESEAEELARVVLPLDLLERVGRGALDDAGIAAAEVDAIGVVQPFAWRAHNPPALLAERLGTEAAGVMTSLGGETPLVLVNELARRIERGEIDVALVGSTHQVRALRIAHRSGVKLDLGPAGSGEPEWLLGHTLPGSSERENRYDLSLPTVLYPLFENALRARRGLDLETHRRAMGRLMERFTEVAAGNPHAWYPRKRTAEELTTPTSENRMVAFPYTKYLNAIMETNQGAGLVLASAGAARRLGVPEAQKVHWWGGAHAVEEPWFPTERRDLDSSPALAHSVASALAEAATELEALDHFDFYSCFPSAVSMACEMLGLDEDDPRGLTVTGGLPYAGGPGNGYCLHSTASMVERIRERGGAGMVTGNGWYFTKHSALVCGAGPRPGSKRAAPEPLPAREGPSFVEEASGEATVEAYTVRYRRDGSPRDGLVVGRLASGERFLARVPDDGGVLEAMVTTEMVGHPGRVTSRDAGNVFAPA